jgi:hypothetical protein
MLYPQASPEIKTGYYVEISAWVNLGAAMSCVRQVLQIGFHM